MAHGRRGGAGGKCIASLRGAFDCPKPLTTPQSVGEAAPAPSNRPIRPPQRMSQEEANARRFLDLADK